ncbi:MAG: hypothetical protein AAF682_01045 [Planctomycetota bacterium]
MTVDESFLTTRWSVVLAVGDPDPASARDALLSLCEGYWYPVYAYIRRRGSGADEAADLTQGFFARLVEKRDLGGASPERGRFRAFLLAAVRNFMANERDRAAAAKRGGGVTPLSFDFEGADTRYALEPADERTPEHVFERSWALALLDRAYEALRSDYEASGRGEIFDALKEALQGSAPARPYAELAGETGMTVAAVKVAVHRLRRRWKERLRAEIAGTVSTDEEAEAELGALFEALSRG